jgi:hypothetical protein
MKKHLMNASEIGRHLAILGLCHSALINPEKAKHYYLASDAKMTSFDPYSTDTSKEYLYVRAKSTFINKRQLASETELYDQKGELLAKMHVQYHVLLEAFFLSRFSHADSPISLKYCSITASPWLFHGLVSEKDADAYVMC